MKRFDPITTVPLAGERVFVETLEGSQLYARRELTRQGWLWIDDSGAWIRSPVGWWQPLESKAISLVETPK